MKTNEELRESLDELLAIIAEQANEKSFREKLLEGFSIGLTAVLIGTSIALMLILCVLFFR